MIKNWNITGVIKAGFLLLVFILSVIMPLVAFLGFGLNTALVGLIFGIFAVPLIVKLNASRLNQEITKPNWNENPLNLKRPLNFYQFAGFFFIVMGLGFIIGKVVRLEPFNNFGLFNIAFGIGILIGVFIAYFFNRSEK